MHAILYQFMRFGHVGWVLHLLTYDTWILQLHLAHPCQHDMTGGGGYRTLVKYSYFPLDLSI